MKALLISIILFASVLSFAQDATIMPSPSPMPVVVESAPQVIEAPPEWLVKSLSYIYEIPFVGPYAAKGAQWLGVIVVIITSFTGATLVSLRALTTVLTLSSLVVWADKVYAFENSKIIYWLKYFSMFNAQKKQ